MIVVLLGYPGSGKTTAMNIILDNREDFVGYSTGDAVRAMASRDIGDYDSDELGEYSTKKRQEDETYALKYSLNQLKNKSSSNYVIEGCRCIAEIDYLNKHYDNVLPIFVQVPFEERYNRVVSRGREGEENMSKQKFRERDEREEGWGMKELKNHEEYYTTINGNVSLSEFKKQVLDLVEENMGD